MSKSIKIGKIGEKTDSAMKDFKKFVNKGNIFDLAVGVIIGSAFTAIVNSLVNDIIMPLISRAINFDLTSAKWILREEVLDEEENVLVSQISVNYGNFIQYTINFLIIAFSIYFAVKVVKWIREGYIRQEIKYIKKLKEKHPEYFDEVDELGTKLYEKLKAEHPEQFENEIAKEIDEQKATAIQKSPMDVNNELLAKLNETLNRIYPGEETLETEQKDI